jgi:penicillin-binding protein 2
MARSCNSYFALAGLEVGIEDIDKWIKAFGLGELSGLEISEYKGYRSNPESMDIFEAGTFHKWSSSSTAQTCIGQLYTMFTPIQVNRYCAAIANGGYVNQMHLVKRVVSENGNLIYETPIVQTKLDISNYALSSVQKSMVTMCDSYRDLQIRMSGYPKGFLAGKTGTAQTGENDESSHAFFMCYAPAADPQISIVVGLEHGAYSGYGFYSVRKLCDSYFQGMYEQGEIGGIGMYEDSVYARGDGTHVSYAFNSVISIIREAEQNSP